MSPHCLSPARQKSLFVTRCLTKDIVKVENQDDKASSKEMHVSFPTTSRESSVCSSAWGTLGSAFCEAVNAFYGPFSTVRTATLPTQREQCWPTCFRFRTYWEKEGRECVWERQKVRWSQHSSSSPWEQEGPSRCTLSTTKTLNRICFHCCLQLFPQHMFIWWSITFTELALWAHE